MITCSVILSISILQFFASDFFTHMNRFKYRAVAMTRAAYVIDLAAARRLLEMVKSLHHFVTVSVIP
jgi:hypothetical protein